MAVGIADLDDLRRVRAARIAQLGGSFVFTRNHPRRAEEVLRGGSLYWVIRGPDPRPPADHRVSRQA